MAKIEIVKYTPEHFLKIRTVSEYFSILHQLYDFKSPEMLASYYLRGPAYTMFANNEMVGCAGILRLWKGVGDTWMLATPLIKKYPKAVLCATKIYLAMLIKQFQFERIQAVVRLDFVAAHSFIKRLGFKEEGIMLKFFGGMDFVRYALISGEKGNE